MPQQMIPNFLKNQFSYTFLHAKSNKKPVLTHQWYLMECILQFLEKKIISRHFQLVQNLDCHGISRFHR
jgi:hypothetical protein